MFEDSNGEFYYVELNAPLDVRIKRNKSDNRLLYKPDKRDIKFNTCKRNCPNYKRKICAITITQKLDIKSKK